MGKVIQVEFTQPKEDKFYQEYRKLWADLFKLSLERLEKQIMDQANRIKPLPID